LAKLSLDGASVPHFSLQDGILRYKNRVWVGSDVPLHHKLVAAFHQSPVGGHSGVPVTYRKIKQVFAWKGMKTFVQNWVASCLTCQQAKPDRSKYPGLLQPLPIPKTAWHTISMDFIEGLPRSQRYDCILVVVDLFTKYAHFVTLSHPFSALTVAQSFFKHIYKLHGLPSAIVSDRDKIFISHFWKQLFKLAGVSLRMSSSYHPQTDGQTERVNQCLETYLRCFVHACPSKWASWIAAAEFWYNTSHHSSIGRSPFEALYGYQPKHFGAQALDSSSTDLTEFLQEKERIHQLLHQHLLRAKQRMKHQTDKQRSERTFQVGDLVFVKLQPYVQSSVSSRANQKLGFRYFGPYCILSRIGATAYKLQLPSSSSVHPVFHVSQLKRVVQPATQVSSDLPDISDPFQIPVAVLQRRVVSRGLRAVQQGLIQWSSLSPSLATWEDLEALRQRFPLAPAWGQAGAQGGGNVSTQDNTLQTSTPSATDGDMGAEEVQVSRPKRTARPSSRVTGPEWVR
jgi:transposase InsO family protein